MSSGPFEDWWWLENDALFARFFEKTAEVMDSGVESVPATTIYELKLMLDTLIRRAPEFGVSELVEFQHALRTALAGRVEDCGHA